MSSSSSNTRGKSETAVLKAKIEAQLSRLLLQLEDIEELKADLDDEEYEITKKETLEQMEDFQATLQKMISGDLSLIDELGGIQLAIQAAVSNAFKTPEVIKLFAKKEPNALRERWIQLQRDFKLGKLAQTDFSTFGAEVLSALKKLGEALTAEESEFLRANMTKELENFEIVSEDESVSVGQKALSRAGRDAQRSQGK
eukprot:ANDGO_03838.mRNA.1 Protein LZIC